MKSVKNNVTIKDIAKALNISATTVSRALHGGEKISDKTKNKVVELAKKLNYRPNSVARNLQRKATKLIGVIIPEFNHNFFSMMLHGIEDSIRDLGYQMIINSTSRDYQNEKEACFSMVDAQVDGLLIALSQDTKDYSFLNEILEKGIPIVLLDRICEDIDTSTVITDDFAGALKAVEYLLSVGHHNIIHLKGDAGISTTFNRYMGYIEAYKRKGLPINTELIIDEEKDEDIFQKLKLLLQQEEHPTAIFSSSDYLAFKALEVVKALKLEVPNQIAIIGYADEPITRYTTPKLSTVRQPSYEMGQKAVKLIKEYEEGASHQNIIINTDLVIRESC